MAETALRRAGVYERTASGGFTIGRPGGDVDDAVRALETVLEVIGPLEAPAEPRPGYVAGLCFECKEIDALTADLKAKGYPIGEPHPALQGGRIVSVHQTGACGVPLAFIDFTDSSR